MTVAVIPTRGEPQQLLADNVHQLLSEGVTTVLIDTCGVGHYIKPETKALANAVVKGNGRNIHRWWNQGLDWARDNRPGEHVAILNDDIIMAEHMVDTLSRWLDLDPLVGLVSPTVRLTGRPAPKRLEAASIATQLSLKGEPGFTGWAFVMRNEAYRFPEQCTWWYGDNDLLRTVYSEGRYALSVCDTWCEHVDGGGKTGKWDDPSVVRVLEEDGRAFNEKWLRYGFPRLG